METPQETVEDKYIDEAGLIHAYPKNENSQVLSESIGLYLIFLLNAEDERAFEEQFEILKGHFVEQKDHRLFIRWNLSDRIQVNALIDDLRIIDALKRGTKVFGDKKYAEYAQQLEITIAETQTMDGYIRDFYDWDLEMPAQRITLSYLVSEEQASQEALDLLRKAGGQPLFFPEYYDLERQSYQLDSEAHMIDQLLIALNRLENGEPSEKFDEWLTKEWNKEQKLFGRYDRSTAMPVVEYESLAVYYYLHAYFREIGKNDLAKEVMSRSKRIATETVLADSHFFDFIHFQLMLQEQ